MQEKARVAAPQIEAARDVFLLRLLAPETARRARPGQFVMLRVDDGLDPLLARPFSIHGVEGGELRILYRVVGKGTRILAKKTEAHTLTLWGPLGRGFNPPEKPALLVAGGMGIAPLAFLAQRLWGGSSPFRALYGAARREDLIHAPEAAGDKLDISGVPWEICTDDGSLGPKGLVTGPMKQMLEGPEAPGEVLACGPLPMLAAVARLAAEHGVSCQVSLEAPMACGVGACLGCALPKPGGGYLRVCQEGPVVEADQVDWERLAGR